MYIRFYNFPFNVSKGVEKNSISLGGDVSDERHDAPKKDLRTGNYWVR